MKIIKIIIASILIGFIAFLILKPKQINLEGNWKATRVVINDKDLLSSDSINKFFSINGQVIINNWGHSIQISLPQQKIKAIFLIKNDDNGNNLVILSSREKSLNGKFTMEIDTTDIGPQAYRIDVKLQLNKTHLYFQREVYIPPWKPEFPKRGQV